jgi:hypothetical protein
MVRRKRRAKEKRRRRDTSGKLLRRGVNTKDEGGEGEDAAVGCGGGKGWETEDDENTIGDDFFASCLFTATDFDSFSLHLYTQTFRKDVFHHSVSEHRLK